MSASISEGSVFGMSSRLAILGCLWRSLGQASTSANSESDRIHFCHAAPPQGDDTAAATIHPATADITRADVVRHTKADTIATFARATGTGATSKQRRHGGCGMRRCTSYTSD